MQENKSYVFFRELPEAEAGAVRSARKACR